MANHATEHHRSRHSRPGETVVETESGLTVRSVETIQAIDRDRWNTVVERSDLGTVFHRYEWLDAIETGVGHQPYHLLVEKDTNPVGVFPNFVVPIPKTPFTRLSSIYPGFGGPLLTTDVGESLSLVLDTAAERCTGTTIVHEIRASNPDFLRYNDRLEERGYEAGRMGGRFVLTLTKGYDQLRSEMDSSKRRAIRRGQETDHEIVEEAATVETLERFYHVYLRQMDRVGGDAFPFAFFERLVAMDDRILQLGLRVEGEYVGGFLLLRNDEQSTLHCYFASVLESAFEYHGSELLYAHAIQWAIDHGYDTFDFGGSGADFEDGAFSFKEGFGGTLLPNCFWECGQSPVWRAVDIGRSLYRRYGE